MLGQQSDFRHWPQGFIRLGSALLLGVIAVLSGKSAACGTLERYGSWQFREPVGTPVAEPLVLLDVPAKTLPEIAPALAARGARGIICFAGEPLPATAGDRMFLRTVRDRLATLGLNHLFFRTAPLQTAETGLRALDRFTEEIDSLARTAKWCGAKGLWLDLPVTESIFLLDHPIPETELVRAGRRIYAAAARRFPDAELLVYGGPESAPGPRWRAMLEGLVEGAGVADTPRITVIRTLNRAPATFEEITTAAGSVARMAAGTFVLSNRERWERLGGTALLLDAAAYAGLDGEQDAAAKAFRIARDLALAVSDRWTVLQPENRTGNVPEEGPALRLVSPLRGLNRLGTLENDLRAPDQIIRAFEHDGHLALLFPDGLPAALEVSGNYRICASVSLAEGTRTFHLARNGKVVIPPCSGPQLITGLPGGTDLAGAGWSWAVDPPLEAGPRRLNFMVSWTNRTGLIRQGDLVAIAAPRWSLGAATMPFHAAPGETVTLRRTLQGVARPGERFSAQLLLQEPGLPPITRTVSVPVFPRLLWTLPLDGPCLPDRVLLDAESLDTLRVVAAAERSGPVCFDADGLVIWNSMKPGPWLCGPVRVSQGDQILIAMGSRQGDVVFWEARSGLQLGSLLLDGTPVRVLTAVSGNRLIALTDRGTCYGIEPIRKIWAVDMNLGVIRICPAQTGDRVLVCGAVGRRGEAVGLSPDGFTQWRAELPGIPIAAEPMETGGWWVGFTDGNIAKVDSSGTLDTAGLPVFSAPLKALAPLTAAAFEPVLKQEKSGNRNLMMAVDRQGLVIASGGHATRVLMPHRSLEWLHHEPAASILTAGAADGTLYCLDLSGRMLWFDSRAWGAPRWVLVRPAGLQRLAVMAAFADGVIRAWDGGPVPKRK